MNSKSSPALGQYLDVLRAYRPQLLPSAGQRASAVLIPILNWQAPRLLYTLRGDQLKHHAGQISFPGGAIEAGETPWQAALREAHEEVGVPPASVEFVCRLDDVISPRGFHVACLVGLVEQRFEPVLNPIEVAALVEADIHELFDDQRHEIKPWKGYKVHYFNFQQGLVWGITGGITFRLKQTLLGGDTSRYS